MPATGCSSDGFGPQRRFEAIIAEENRQPVGYALFWPIYDTELGAPSLFLSDLMVSEAARGRGIARDLMAEVARRAIALSMPRLLWDVLESNGRARAFYRIRRGATMSFRQLRRG